jgi:predicted nucleotidyltransferase
MHLQVKNILKSNRNHTSKHNYQTFYTCFFITHKSQLPNIFVFSDHFDALISKIIFKK